MSKKYLVAVKCDDGNEIFEFDKKDNRDKFVDDCKKRKVDCLISEVE